MYTRVTTKNILLGRGSSFVPLRECLEQDLQPLGGFGMVAGRMEARERRMRQDVDAASIPPSRASASRACVSQLSIARS
jgi:hypothetical protein